MGQRQNSFKTIAVLLALVMSPVSLSFAALASTTSAAFPAPQLLARLTTKGNLPISVNGVNASSGDSVANEAMIQTPGNVDANVDLGPLGSLDLDSDTRIKLEYEGNCIAGSSGPQVPALQKCSVKVTIYAGCVTAHYKEGSYFQVVGADQKLIRDSDKNRKNAGTFKVCDRGPAGAAAVPGGLSNLAKVAIAALAIGTTGIILIILNDPSPATP